LRRAARRTRGGQSADKWRSAPRAIRRAGELLKQIEPATGAHRKSTAADTLSRKDAAETAGMSKRQAVTAIRVANVASA